MIGFSLPSTSTLKSVFLGSSKQICSAFTGDSGCKRDQEKAWQLEALLATAGLNNRVTIARPYAGVPTSSYFARYVVPLIQGTDPRVQLPGARLTSIDAWWGGCVVAGSGCLSDGRVPPQHGFADRFVVYNLRRAREPRQRLGAMQADRPAGEPAVARRAQKGDGIDQDARRPSGRPPTSTSWCR